MQIIISLLIFIIFSALAVTLFCLLSWYFNKKHGQYNNPNLQDTNLTNLQNDPYLSQVKDGQNQKQIQMQKFKPNNNKINFSKLSQTDGMLSNRLLNSSPQHTNSKNNTLRSSSNSQNSDIEQRQGKVLNHVYISRLAAYTNEGIQLYEKQLKTIKIKKIFKNLRWQQEVQQLFDVVRETYLVDCDNFMDVLDIIKMEQGQYGAIKFVCEIKIRNYEKQKEYSIDEYTKNESFEFIDLEQYDEEVQKLQGI